MKAGVERLSGHRIDARRAAPAALKPGRYRRTALLLVVQDGHEVRRQHRLVVLRLHPVEADAVVERQAIVGFQLSCRYHSTFQ